MAIRPPTPGQTTQYVTGSGFDLVTSCAAPGIGAGGQDFPVVTIQAIARPSAWLLGPGLSAVLAQLNTYYGAGKAASVFAAVGISATPVAGGAGAGPGTPLVVINSDLVVWTTLAADAAAQLALMVTLLGTGGNTNKGGNP